MTLAVVQISSANCYNKKVMKPKNGMNFSVHLSNDPLEPNRKQATSPNICVEVSDTSEQHIKPCVTQASLHFANLPNRAGWLKPRKDTLNKQLLVSRKTFTTLT
jgi:hypothetical protein